MLESSHHPPAHHPTDQPGPASSFTDYLLALLAAFLALVLYFRTLAPGLLGGDSGEFQFAAWLGGFVHPTGYPLYLILGYLWTHLLQLGDPAWRMNLFSALWGGGAVGLFYLLAARMAWLTSARLPALIRRALALFAAFTFAVTPTLWSQAVIAEVYTLHAAFVIAVLLGLVTWAETHDRRAFYATAALYGLSLTHHRTMLLLAPAMMVFVWLVWRGRAGEQGGGKAWSVKRGARSEGAGEPGGHHAPRLPLSPCLLVFLSTCLLLPLLLYVYIPLRAPLAPYANVHVGPDQTLALYQPTWRGFLQYVAGQTFEGEIGAVAQAVGRLVPAARLFVHEVTWAGVALGLIGLLWLAWRNRPLLALTGLSFLAVVGFNLFYGIGDIHVFYIPAYLIWVVWAALGVGGIGKLGIGKLGIGKLGIGKLGISCLLALILPAWLLLARYPQIDQSRNNQARTMWRMILAQSIPENAILVSNDRDEMTPLLYLQYVEGIRPDLTGLFPLIQPTPEWTDVGRVTDAALRSGRPVLLIKPMPGLEVKFRLEPAGSLVRVVGPAVEQPPVQPQTVVYAETLRMIGYDLRPAAVSPGGQMVVTLYWQPIRQLDADYTTFVHLIDADGARIAQSDQRPGGVYYPTSLWRPGELLRDVHTLTLVPDLGRPPYAILVGLYTGTTEIRHLGQPQQVGVVGW